jgi:hypothetical protein
MFGSAALWISENQQLSRTHFHSRLCRLANSKLFRRRKRAAKLRGGFIAPANVAEWGRKNYFLTCIFLQHTCLSNIWPHQIWIVN